MAIKISSHLDLIQEEIRALVACSSKTNFSNFDEKVLNSIPMIVDFDQIVLTQSTRKEVEDPETFTFTSKS